MPGNDLKLAIMDITFNPIRDERCDRLSKRKNTERNLLVVQRQNTVVVWISPASLLVGSSKRNSLTARGACGRFLWRRRGGLHLPRRPGWRYVLYNSSTTKDREDESLDRCVDHARALLKLQDTDVARRSLNWRGVDPTILSTSAGATQRLIVCLAADMFGLASRAAAVTDRTDQTALHFSVDPCDAPFENGAQTPTNVSLQASALVVVGKNEPAFRESRQSGICQNRILIALQRAEQGMR